MDVKFTLDETASAQLKQLADAEDRTPDMQARSMLRKALELHAEDELKSAEAEKRRTQRTKPKPVSGNGAGVVGGQRDG